MIRIVSKIKYQGKCDACGIGITCEKEDVTNVQVGMNELGNFVECPSCGEKIRVTEYKIMSALRKKTNNRTLVKRWKNVYAQMQ